MLNLIRTIQAGNSVSTVFQVPYSSFGLKKLYVLHCIGVFQWFAVHFKEWQGGRGRSERGQNSHPTAALFYSQFLSRVALNMYLDIDSLKSQQGSMFNNTPKKSIKVSITKHLTGMFRGCLSVIPSCTITSPSTYSCLWVSGLMVSDRRLLSHLQALRACWTKGF